MFTDTGTDVLNAPDHTAHPSIVNVPAPPVAAVTAPRVGSTTGTTTVSQSTCVEAPLGCHAQRQTSAAPGVTGTVIENPWDGPAPGTTAAADVEATPDNAVVHVPWACTAPEICAVGCVGSTIQPDTRIDVPMNSMDSIAPTTGILPAGTVTGRHPSAPSVPAAALIMYAQTV